MPKPLIPGQRIKTFPISMLNELDRKARQAQHSIKGNGTGNQSGSSSYLDISVSNDSGGDLTAEFPILALDGPKFTTAVQIKRRRVLYSGITPDEDTGVGFVVLQGPCKSGKPGLAVKQGYTCCQIDVTDESHEYARAKSGDTAKLESSESGVKIDWVESGTGVKNALIYLGGDAQEDEINSTFYQVINDDIPAAYETVEDIPGVPGDQIIRHCPAGEGQKFVRYSEGDFTPDPLDPDPLDDVYPNGTIAFYYDESPSIGTLIYNWTKSFIPEDSIVAVTNIARHRFIFSQDCVG